ncbi:MAG TPA: class I SAM-dependent methyltransferase [Pseudonocardiaceae bacterium]
MAALATVHDHLSAGTSQLVSVVGCGARNTLHHRATLDRFLAGFAARTRQVQLPAALTEITYSPVLILAAVLTVTTVLATPRADVLTFVLLGPVVGSCARRLTQQPSSMPSPARLDAGVRVRAAARRLLSVVPRSGVVQAAVAAVVAGVLYGVSFGLALSVIWPQPDQHGARWPLYSMLVVAVMYAVTSLWASSRAQLAGVAILQQLSHRIIDRITSAPPAVLATWEDRLPRMATRDVVAIAGIPVHSVRSLIATGLPPVAAIAAMMLTARWLAVPILLLSSALASIVFVLLRKPYRDLRSALAITATVLDFLSISDSGALRLCNPSYAAMQVLPPVRPHAYHPPHPSIYGGDSAASSTSGKVVMVETSQTDRATDRPYLDDLAELYDRFIRVMDLPGNPGRVWLMAELPGGRKAIDLGCGNGRTCRMIADRYDEVLGIDVSSRVLEIARAKANPPNVRYECRDVLDLSAEEDGTFDTVFTTNSAFFMGPADVVLPQFRELLAPGGRLVVLDMTRPDEDPRKSISETGMSQSFQPFEIAHTIYQVSSDIELVIDALRYMLHPRWKEMSEENIPPTLSEFRQNYHRHFPGVRITENVIPNLSGAVWQADPA